MNTATTPSRFTAFNEQRNIVGEALTKLLQMIVENPGKYTVLPEVKEKWIKQISMIPTASITRGPNPKVSGSRVPGPGVPSPRDPISRAPNSRFPKTNGKQKVNTDAAQTVSEKPG